VRRRIALPGIRHDCLALWCLLGMATVFQVAAAAAEPVLFEVAQATVAYDQRSGAPMVTFRFTPDSARKFAEFTSQNVGRTTEIRLDGKVYSRPVIREPIVGGSGQIAGHLSVREADDLAARLSPGTKLEIEAVAD
jgi:hypothetical protein